jgi:hypothetical protein
LERPIDGRKHLAVRHQWDPKSLRDRALGGASTCDARLAGGASFFERLPVRVKAAIGHFPDRTRLRTMAEELAAIMAGQRS